MLEERRNDSEGVKCITDSGKKRTVRASKKVREEVCACKKYPNRWCDTACLHILTGSWDE